MNQKIKELAEQAWPNLPPHWWERQDGEVARCTSKFAQLIIQECADVARQHCLLKADRSYMIHTAIKQHFGIEK